MSESKIRFHEMNKRRSSLGERICFDTSILNANQSVLSAFKLFQVNFCLNSKT